MEWTDFTGGLWLPEDVGFAVPPNALLQADEVRPLVHGGLRGQRGYARYDDSGAGGLGGSNEDILMLWRHYPRTGAAAFLAADHDGADLIFKHDTNDDTTFSTMTGGSVTMGSQRPYGVNWPEKNASFFVANNSTFGLRKYNGSLASVSITGTAVDGPYIHLWNSRLFVCKSDEANYSIYVSKVNDETNFPGVNQLNVSDAQGGLITGISSHIDRVIIFKKTSVFRFWGDIETNPNLKEYTSRGCVAPDSIAQMPKGVIYVAREGVYLTDGMDPTGVELSLPIRALFTDRTTENVYSTAVGIYQERARAYYLKLAPANNEVYICYFNEDFSKWGWYKKPTLPANAFAVWESENDTGRLFTGDTSGFVWEADTGTTNNATAITSTIQLPFRIIAQNGIVYEGRATSVMALYRALGALTVNLRYDNTASNDVALTLGATQASARVQNPLVKVTDRSKHGQFISMTAAAAGGPAVEIHRLEARMTKRGPFLWNYDVADSA